MPESQIPQGIPFLLILNHNKWGESLLKEKFPTFISFWISKAMDHAWVWLIHALVWLTHTLTGMWKKLQTYYKFIPCRQLGDHEEPGGGASMLVPLLPPCTVNCHRSRTCPQGFWLKTAQEICQSCLLVFQRSTLLLNIYKLPKNPEFLDTN